MLRVVQQQWQAVSARDGAGVNLNRVLGARHGQRMDPFLMLDAFMSDDPNDYIAGFPAHPHRGFETITYIVQGHMRHRDHLGNEGDLKAGGVQWMTAGRGIIHEEMPQQKDGLLLGFQLWLNLPADEKMKPAHYEDIPAEAMPWQTLNAGGEIKLIAGTLADNRLIADNSRRTAPIIADIALVKESVESLQLPEKHSSLVFVFSGKAQIGKNTLASNDVAILSEGTTLEISGLEENTRLLLLAGAALHEPIAQYGPFVMNTEAQLQQAIDDYRNGTLTE